MTIITSLHHKLQVLFLPEYVQIVEPVRIQDDQVHGFIFQIDSICLN